jgi:hypothetical protein
MPGPEPRPSLQALNLRLAFGLMDLTHRLHPVQRRPGVRKFRSREDALANENSKT